MSPTADWQAGYDAGYAAGLAAARPPAAAGPPPAVSAAAQVEATSFAPFVLRIWDGPKLVHAAGPYAKITDAIDARDAWDGARPGLTATISEGAELAQYRGGDADFVFRRTQWSRAS